MAMSTSSKLGVVAVLVVTLIAGFLIYATLNLPSPPETTLAPIVPAPRAERTSVPAPPRYEVTYRLTGTRGRETPVGSLTYTNAGGDTEQIGAITLPWEINFTSRRGAFLYVSVQNKFDHGSVKCEILLDGVVVKESSSTGGYVIASCSGRV